MRAYQRGVFVNAKEEHRGEKNTLFRQVWLLPSDDTDPAQLMVWDNSTWESVLAVVGTGEVVVVEVEFEARTFRNAGQLSQSLRGVAEAWPGALSSVG